MPQRQCRCQHITVIAAGQINDQQMAHAMKSGRQSWAVICGCLSGLCQDAREAGDVPDLPHEYSGLMNTQALMLKLLPVASDCISAAIC